MTTPLDELGAWSDLISFRPPAKVQMDLKTRAWYVHHIEDAYGPINLDYYPVHVAELPTIDGVDAGGRPWASRTLSNKATAAELLRYIRNNINLFVDTTVCEFTGSTRWDEKSWSDTLTSDDSKPAGYTPPVGTVVHIEMRAHARWANVDDGSVVCSKNTSDHWIFSTIYDFLRDFNHPVSGNRQFGFSENSSGAASPLLTGSTGKTNNFEKQTYTFYTRGADRPSGISDYLINETAFGMGHALWLSLQAKIEKYVNDHGGKAQKLDPSRSAKGYPWDEVRKRYFNPRGTWAVAYNGPIAPRAEIAQHGNAPDGATGRG